MEKQIIRNFRNFIELSKEGKPYRLEVSDYGDRFLPMVKYNIIRKEDDEETKSYLFYHRIRPFDINGLLMPKYKFLHSRISLLAENADFAHIYCGFFRKLQNVEHNGMLNKKKAYKFGDEHLLPISKQELNEHFNYGTALDKMFSSARARRHGIKFGKKFNKTRNLDTVVEGDEEIIVRDIQIMPKSEVAEIPGIKYSNNPHWLECIIRDPAGFKDALKDAGFYTEKAWKKIRRKIKIYLLAKTIAKKQEDLNKNPKGFNVCLNKKIYTDYTPIETFA